MKGENTGETSAAPEIRETDRQMQGAVQSLELNPIWDPVLGGKPAL